MRLIMSVETEGQQIAAQVGWPGERSTTLMIELGSLVETMRPLSIYGGAAQASSHKLSFCDWWICTASRQI